jgi:D-glycero-alpha-D-manno-heptose-7-phosphate kinase
MNEQPVIRSKAPLRISFAGGGSDLPSYYEENGGAVLCSTINRYAFVTLRPRRDAAVNIRSLDFDLTVKYRLDEEPIYDGTLDLAKVAIRRVNSERNGHGFDLYLQSDAPAGSGLGGSASLTIALIGALAELLGKRLDRYQTAELAYAIERLDLGISGGKQDQYTTAFGGFNLIEFSRERVVVNPLRVDPGTLSDLEHHLMLCYTGATRFSAGLMDRQETYLRQNRPDTVAGLRDLHQLTYQMKDALLTGRLRDFAELLEAAWCHKRRVNPEVTDERIDRLCRRARRSGAIACKLLGAGGGGYLLIFCEVGKRRRVREALEGLGGQFTDFSFIEGGLQVWHSTCP